MIVALPLYGLSALLTGLLGASHFHTPVVLTAMQAEVSMAGWQDFRRVNHVTDSVFHVHDHAKLGRHHHDALDPGVVVVGADEHDGGPDGAVTTAGGALVLAASDALSFELPVPTEVSVAWIEARPCAFRSCDARRLERPPKA